MKRIVKYSISITILLILALSVFPINISKGITFTANDLPYNIKFTQVDSYQATTLALDDSGNIWAWGDNQYGQLGIGNTTNKTVPVQVTSSSTKYKYVTAGTTSAAIDTNGNIWAWGYNLYSQVGNTKTAPSSNSYRIPDVKSPTQITTGTRFTKVISANEYMVALDESGNIWGWGSNRNYTLLQTECNWKYNNVSVQTYPIKITSGKRYTKLEASSANIAAIDSSNNLWIAGYGGSGMLCDSSLVTSYRSVFVNLGSNYKDVKLGSTFGLALDNSNNLYGWGLTYWNTSTGATKYTMEKMDSNVTYISARDGDHYSYGRPSSSYPNYAKVGGRNNNGVLGDNGYNSSSKYADYNFTKFKNIYVGSNDTIAFDASGNLWMWGANAKGQLAVGDTVASYNHPIQITGTKYTVTFIVNGGTINTGKITEYTSGVETALPTDVTRTGYTFGGWYTNSSITGSAVTKIGEDETGNKTFYAKWSADKADYTVEHYKQNIDLKTYTKADTETIKDKNVGAVATAISKASSYTGFSENTKHADRIATGNVKADGSLVLKLYYDRDSYTVTLNKNDGNINKGDVTSYVYGIGATLPTDVTKAGYTFGGWYTNSSLTGSAVTKIGETETGNKTFYAKWTANTNTAYKIEHYKQDTNLSTYTKADTDDKTGTTGTTATATAKTNYTGFTENTTHSQRVASGTITGDGKLVLKLYYDRNRYTVTLNKDGGLVNKDDVTSYVYGIGATLPTDVTKAGYTFGGWYTNSSLTGSAVTKIGETETGNKTFYAKWTIKKYTVTFKDGDNILDTQEIEHGKPATAPTLTKPGYDLTWDKDFSNVTEDLIVSTVWVPKTNTPYKIEYYRKNLDTELEGYEKFDEVQERGTTDTEVTAPVKEYEGFTQNTTHPERVPSGRITGDGSLVLKLYYDRNIYNITYVLNGGMPSGILPDKYTYGKEVILSDRVVKPGYIFDGWYNNSNFTGATVTKIGETETGDKTFYAKWRQGEYTVTFKDGDTVLDTQKVKGEEAAIPPTPTKPGYDLTWDKDFSSITEDLIVSTVWVPRTDTQYNIEYYVRNLDTELEGYKLLETIKYQGTTDTEVTAQIKQYEGFTQNTTYSGNVLKGNISGDGSLVLKVYYNRNNYNITYELNGGTVVGRLTPQYTYGKELILSNRVTKPGYEFAGWYDNSDYEGETIAVISANQIGDKTLYAKWTENNEYNILTDKYSINTEENYITKVGTSTTVESFINNITTNGSKKILNMNDEEMNANDLVGTGCKLQVEYNGEKHIYEIAVRGDLDGNGKITITDLSILNDIYVNRKDLGGVRQKAADIDYSEKITITDLSMMNQAIVEKKDL